MHKTRVVTLFILLTIGWTLGQIHFTPDWTHTGKRSSRTSQFEDDEAYSSSSCLEQTELAFVLDIAKLLTAEAKRLSTCMKD